MEEMPMVVTSSSMSEPFMSFIHTTTTTTTTTTMMMTMTLGSRRTMTVGMKSRRCWVTTMVVTTVLALALLGRPCEGFHSVLMPRVSVASTRGLGIGVSPSIVSRRQQQQQQNWSAGTSLQEKRTRPQLTSWSSLPSLVTLQQTASNAALPLDGSGDMGKKDTSSSPQSIATACFGLIKACVGSGILSLPYGLAVMSDTASVVMPATIFMLVLAAFSGYTFALLGRICHDNGAKTIGEAWELEIGPSTTWIVDLSTFVFAVGCTLSFSIVLGDFLSSLVQGIASSMSSTIFTTASSLQLLRQFCILAITATALYPLSLLDSLAKLAPVSVAGVAGVILTSLYMVLRCSFSTAYHLPHGRFLPDVPALPVFGTRPLSAMNPFSCLILASTLANAFLAHFAAPDFVMALTGTNNDNSTSSSVLTRFAKLTFFGFGGTALINAIVMISGFLTFGGQTAGVILNNYATNDVGASLCRLFTIVSITGAFPFLVKPGRESLTNLVWKNKPFAQERRFQKLLTTALVAIPTVGALLTDNAGLIVSFNGALMGSAIIYIFPPLLFLANRSRGSRLERMANRFLVAFGVVAASVGASVSLIQSMAPHLLR